MKNGEWTSIPALKTFRRSAGSSITSMGLLVTGGYSGDSVLKTTEIGNIFGVWVEGPPLPLPSYLHCQVTVGSTVFILGMTFFISVLTLIIPGYFQNNLSRGGAQLSSPLNPLKIQHFNGFCKFCFYRGLDMYIKG